MYIVINVKKAIFIGGCVVLCGVGYTKFEHFRQQIKHESHVRTLINQINKLHEEMTVFHGVSPRVEVHDIFRRRD